MLLERNPLISKIDENWPYQATEYPNVKTGQLVRIMDFKVMISKFEGLKGRISVSYPLQILEKRRLPFLETGKQENRKTEKQKNRKSGKQIQRKYEKRQCRKWSLLN
jgi:hypothetical protein